MGTKNQSYTIEEETIYKLGVFAGIENISKSRAVNKILDRFLNVEVKISLTDTPYEKKVPVIQPEMTPEEYKKDWEWRKKMVEEGKFPVHMGDEFPVVELEDRKDIYLTDDGLPSDCSAKIDVNKISKKQEDKEFDQSVADALKE